MITKTDFDAKLSNLNRKTTQNKSKHLLVENELCLGYISKDWSTDNKKKTGFNEYVYDFSGDYDATDTDDIKDIRKYLILMILKTFINI